MPNEFSNFTMPDTGSASQGYQDRTWDPNANGGKGGWVTPGQGSPGNATFSQYGQATGASYDPQTGQTSVSRGAGPGKVMNDQAWGGYSARAVLDENGNVVVDPGQSGRAEDVDRYKGMAQDAANRSAYQIDYAKADRERALAAQARGRQSVAAGMLGQAALGNAPSEAAIRQNSAMDQGLASSLSGMGGARVGNQSTFANRAMAANAANNIGVANHFTGARSDELARDLSGYTGAGKAIRGGDLTAQGLVQDRQRHQLQSELAQRGMNQDEQLAYEKMGANVNQAAQDNAIANYAITNKAYEDAQRRDVDKSGFTLNTAGNVANSFVDDLGKVGGGKKKKDEEV